MPARAILFLVAAALASAPASAELDLNRAEVSHLPNGLTVIMLEDHSFPLVSVQMLYKSGSAAETTGKTGLAHFMEHLAFRGSTNFPNERATELIYDAGGEWHGYTAMDQTTYFATMPKDGLDLLLKIEADRMARTMIDPASIEAEKGAVITELHSYENDPASVLQDAVTRTALQVHPYGSPMAGYVSDVARLTAEDALAYYASHYAPGNAVLAVVGDFAPSQAHALIAKDFADVPARAVAETHLTTEPPQLGERRVRLAGPVKRQYFMLAYPAPAASNPDFPAFLVLQELLAGGSGLNLRQSDWAPTQAKAGSALFGAADDIGTWLPPTRDPFLFTINGSIPLNDDATAVEKRVRDALTKVGADRVPESRIAAARRTVIQAIQDDVQTTEDAAHQLAFFEGIGAFEALMQMPRKVSAVMADDVRRVARTYLRAESATIGWMMPGDPPSARPGAGLPKAAADRNGPQAPGQPVTEPELRHLRSGLPVVVERSSLSDSVTVEVLVAGTAKDGTRPTDLPGLDAIVRSGRPGDLGALLSAAIASSHAGGARQARSGDPATRLEQLIQSTTIGDQPAAPAPLAVIVTGNVEPQRAFDLLDRQLGVIPQGKLSTGAPLRTGTGTIRERIAEPLPQGALGYVVAGPAPGTREALAWKMLLYVLTHDYSGRLGLSAIRDRGLVYDIESELRTDGRRSWAVISTGVDPGKADAMEAELRRQLALLATEPPSPVELAAARNHLLGRDLSAAQSNEELAARIARQLIERGALRSHEQLKAALESISAADVAAAVPAFAAGTIIRVDVGPAR